MQKKIILLFLTVALFSAASPVFSSEQNKSFHVKVAVLKHFPPQYLLSKTGKPEGFAIDIVEEIAKLAKLDIEYVLKDSWSEMCESLKSGQTDLIPNQGITDRRKQWFAFSQPVETFPVSIFIRKHGEEFQTIQDLIGKKVAVVKTNIGEVLLKNNPKILVLRYDHAEDALFSLLSGTVDAMIFPEPVLWKMARDARIDGKIDVTGKPLVEIKRGISVAKNNKFLLQKIHTAVEQFVGSKRYNEIYTKWYGEPKPYWTNRKFLGIVSGLFFFVVLFMGMWRYRSIVHLNVELHKNIKNRVSAEKQLQEAYDTLEKKVDQRTADLSRSNDELNKEIEKRKQIAKDLLNSERDLQRTLDATADGIWSWNFTTNELYFSPKYYEMLGYVPNEFKPTFENWLDLIHPDDRERVLDGTNKFLKTKPNVYDNEFRLRTKIGDYRWIRSVAKIVERDENGDAIYLIGNQEDITERKLALDALNKEQERFELAMCSVNDGLWDWNVKTNEMYYSPVFKKLLGYEDHELKNEFSEWERLTTPEDVKRSWEILDEVLAGKQNGFENELVMFHKNGHRIVILSRANAVFDENEKITRIIGTCVDITERKRLENQILQSQIELTNMNNVLGEENKNLSDVISGIKTLHGIIPICAKCKKIRNDEGVWIQIEKYIQDHSNAKFSHGLCQKCSDELYGDEKWYQKKNK